MPGCSPYVWVMHDRGLMPISAPGRHACLLSFSEVSSSAYRILDTKLFNLRQYGAYPSDQHCDGPPAFPQSHSFYLHSSCLYFVEASTTELSRRLREHSASASIPSGAFAPFSTLHLNLGISMSLPTPYRFAKAKPLLGSLDLISLTRELSKPSLESAQLGKDSQGSRGHCHSLQQPP